MRLVPQFEQKQRGCEYCMDKTYSRDHKAYRTSCPFPSCPYHELDNHETYEEYMKSDDCIIKVTEFFSSTADCYALQSSARTPRRAFSDGDSKVDM